jgi:hypothetical protein
MIRHRFEIEVQVSGLTIHDKTPDEWDKDDLALAIFHDNAIIVNVIDYTALEETPTKGPTP